MKQRVPLFTAVLCFFAAVSAFSAGPAVIGIAKIVQHPALDAIEQGIQDRLAELNIRAEYDLQNANGDVGTAAQIAALYKSRRVDVAVGIATPIAVALANTIRTSPVVFSCVTDPVAAGLVRTTEHGYRNVTGVSDAIPTVEHIRLFAETAGIRTLGYLYTSDEANSISALELVRQGCREAGIRLAEQSITESSEAKQAAEALVQRVDGLYLTTDNTVFSALSAVTSVFQRARKPVFSGDVTGAMEGGIFMASGFNYYKAGRITGDMIAEILQGTKPAQIPVRFITDPKDSDLLINLDAAENCGISIPEGLLNQANMVFRNGELTVRE